jgi:Fic family protein
MLSLVAQIGEQVGRLSERRESELTPQWRRGNRIRTIQASLAIENNTLSLEQVTAVLDGKRVLGLPHEIQEVRNAFSAYEAMPGWRPDSQTHLLQAHGMLMFGLLDDAGEFRRGGVGIYRGDRLVHMAPPPSRVASLTAALLQWVGHTDLHPLIASCVFHYEFEFIHPFADGNGRMGRLWQTLLLSLWRPVLAWLPVETVIRDQQESYYSALSKADQQAEATPFVEFMLAALQQALLDALTSGHSPEPLGDQVEALLHVLYGKQALKSGNIMQALGLSHRGSFRENHLAPALAAGLIEMTHPGAPRSPAQKYQLTAKGIDRLSSRA